MPIVHLIKLGLERRLDREAASRLLTSLALGNGSLRVPAGCLGDRIGRSAAFTLLLGCYAALDLACSFARGREASVAFLPLFAFFAGGLTGGCNVLTATLPFDVLPRAEADTAMPLIFPFLGVGIAIGPVAAAALHSRTGSYNGVLLGAGAILLLATAMAACVALLARGSDNARAAPADSTGATSMNPVDSAASSRMTSRGASAVAAEIAISEIAISEIAISGSTSTRAAQAQLKDAPAAAPCAGGKRTDVASDLEM